MKSSIFLLLLFISFCVLSCSSLRLDAGSYLGRRTSAGGDKLVSVIAYDDDNEDGSKSAKVQFMITNKMKAKLIDELGYLPEEVQDMEPQIAAVVIERSLSRPKKGMPASWRRTGNNAGVTNSIVQGIQTLRRTVQRGFRRVKVFCSNVYEATEQPEIKAVLRTSAAVGLLWLTRKPLADLTATSWNLVTTKFDEVFSPEQSQPDAISPRRGFFQPRGLPTTPGSGAAQRTGRKSGWFGLFGGKNNDAYIVSPDLDRTDRGRYRDRVDLATLSKAQRLGLIDSIRLNSAIFFNRFKK